MELTSVSMFWRYPGFLVFFLVLWGGGAPVGWAGGDRLPPARGLAGETASVPAPVANPVPLLPDSLKDLWERAQSGNAAAQLELGGHFARGQEVSQDNAAAVDWISRAAAQEDLQAQITLGVAYAEGRLGLTPDPGAALQWLRRAAEGGSLDAKALLGHGLEKGIVGQQDLPEAVRWYRDAASHGHAAAQIALGILYAEGHGVVRSYREAARWYRIAAERGDLEAQKRLGDLYMQGLGVPEDWVLAHLWFNLAAVEGDEEAAQHRLEQAVIQRMAGLVTRERANQAVTQEVKIANRVQNLVFDKFIFVTQAFLVQDAVIVYHHSIVHATAQGEAIVAQHFNIA